MSKIFCNDLHSAKMLDRDAASRIHGGWFGGILGSQAGYSTSDADRAAPELSDIVITKKTDTSTPILF